MRCQECAPRFHGDRCHECVMGYRGSSCEPIKSCRGYNKKSLASGIYKIFDANMNLIHVYCDFDRNSSMSWTLIQSYELIFIKGVYKHSFFRNYPENENGPSWQKYRLSKSRMKSILQDSSKWRITCDYQSSGTVYRDYVRVSNKI